MAGLGNGHATTPCLWVSLSLMLSQQPVESHPLIRQVSKSHSQSFRQCVILTILGVPKPLLQPEGLLDSFIKLPSQPLALLAGFALQGSRFLHCDERAAVFCRKQPVAMPLDMQVKVFQAKEIEKICGRKTQEAASDEIAGRCVHLRVCLFDELPGICTNPVRFDCNLAPAHPTPP